ncbi:protein spire homolog 1-like [Heteronotia binoei]|uniref:protein spire homolog 1-like n=1 Tax=Heteronotia binoei TaxID=13085 RepID=UPI0029302FA9|nr:protein spire homolog 1-like [Heteronotia binoei]
MGKGGGQPSSMHYKKDLVKVSLAEFLQYYEQPISEEQAWAICFQCCYKMRELMAQGGDSVLKMIVLEDINNLYIHSDGSVSFTVQQSLSDSHMTQQQNERLEDMLTELLGKLVYRALDWGIESHMERELSESLEKLISFMLKLNLEATQSAVTFQDVIKICEDHFLKPSEAADHYTVICRVLFAEYIELQKLMLTIQRCKEYLGRMDVEDCCPRQKANDWADLWQDVLGGLQKGARLHKAMEHPQPRTSLKQCSCSLYDTVVDDIKNKHYTLHKASTRQLRERVCQAPSLHDQLMMEVKKPPKLRPVSAHKSKNKQKEDFGKFSSNTPCDIILDQNVGSNITVSKAKKLRLSCIQSDPELKLLSTCTRKPSTRWSLPTLADLMGTRFAEHVAEMKDSSQRVSIFSSRLQVCLACHNELFIWPYICHLCSRVNCKDCCVKVTMPVRPCIRLPLNFFKIIRFSKEDLALQGQKTPQLLYEIEHWDCSRVPLVLEPHCLTPPLASRTRSMMNWPSLDICIKCEQHLLEILSRQVQQKSTCKKRSLSWTEWE